MAEGYQFQSKREKVMFTLFMAVAIVGAGAFALREAFPGLFASLTGGTSIGKASTKYSYQNVQARMLDAHKLEYAEKPVHVTFKVIGVDVETGDQRLCITTMAPDNDATLGIDVIVEENSPLYDQVVRANLQFDRKSSPYPVWRRVEIAR